MPITLQTDASDYGIGGYLFQTIDGLIQVIMCISKALVGAQLRWNAREKECYAIFYCLKVLEIETSNDTDAATLSVAVAQVDISDAEYAIISSQHTRNAEDIQGLTSP